MSRGLLLVNLGTPDDPSTGAVRRYLREFLSDPQVIDLAAPLRWALLNGVILPFRPARSAAAYRQVWTARGSPLLFHSFDLVSEVARVLEGDFAVQLAMRYGNPSLQAGLAALRERGVTRLTVLPLYPQYALSSTQSTIDRVRELVAQQWPGVALDFVPAFYAHPGFLDAFGAVAAPVLQGARPDHVLFSFHGLPERHLTKLDASGSHCLASASCCEAVGAVNANCYRAQSFATARSLASRLALASDTWSVSFQSRLSRRWIRPFTDERLVELANSGVKRLVVVCPAFVADCLETVEEIGLRGRKTFLDAGGEALALVPSLNAHPRWVEAVAAMARAR